MTDLLLAAILAVNLLALVHSSSSMASVLGRLRDRVQRRLRGR